MALNLGNLKKGEKLPETPKTEDQTKDSKKPVKTIAEYSRNLLHKNIYKKNEIDPVLRDRMNVGKRVTVPVFYEEEQLFKAAAKASVDEHGRAYSLNDFIRVALVKAAYDVLGKDKADEILDNQLNLIATEPTTEEERQIERDKRTKAKDTAIRSDANEYPRSPTKTRKRKSPDELASRGRKSNTKPVVG